MLKYFLLLLILSSTSKKLTACICFPGNGVEEYVAADFVAQVKIIFTSVHAAREGSIYNYVLPLRVYKSYAGNSCVIETNPTNSCAFAMDQGGTYLVQAVVRNSYLFTDQCFGSIRLDPIPEIIGNYDAYTREHRIKVARKLKTLDTITHLGIAHYDDNSFKNPIRKSSYNQVSVELNSWNQHIVLQLTYNNRYELTGKRVIQYSQLPALDSVALQMAAPRCRPKLDRKLQPKEEYFLYPELLFREEEGVYELAYSGG